MVAHSRNIGGMKLKQDIIMAAGALITVAHDRTRRCAAIFYMRAIFRHGTPVNWRIIFVSVFAIEIVADLMRYEVDIMFKCLIGWSVAVRNSAADAVATAVITQHGGFCPGTDAPTRC